MYMPCGPDPVPCLSLLEHSHDRLFTYLPWLLQCCRIAIGLLTLKFLLPGPIWKRCAAPDVGKGGGYWRALIRRALSSDLNVWGNLILTTLWGMDWEIKTRECDRQGNARGEQKETFCATAGDGGAKEDNLSKQTFNFRLVSDLEKSCKDNTESSCMFPCSVFPCSILYSYGASVIS